MNKKILLGFASMAIASAVVLSAVSFQLPNSVPATGTLLSGNVMMLTVSGTAEEYKLYDLRGTTYKAVWDCASYAIIMADVADSQSHAIRIGQASKGGCKPHDVYVVYSTVRNSILENYPPSNSKNWGSCIKAELGTKNIHIMYNTITNCYGEGIDTAEVIGAEVIGNTLTNCWSYCIYIDNSVDVLVQGNTTSCPDPAFNRNGGPAVSAGVGDENLSAWGGGGVSIAARITITENTSYKCQAPKYWGSQYSNGGVDTLAITNNQVYDTTTRVSVAGKPRNVNITTTGNVYLTSGTPVQATATRTSTSTAIATRTSTALPATIPAVTPIPCEVIYRIPGVVQIQACREQP